METVRGTGDADTLKILSDRGIRIRHHLFFSRTLDTPASRCRAQHTPLQTEMRSKTDAHPNRQAASSSKTTPNLPNANVTRSSERLRMGSAVPNNEKAQIWLHLAVDKARRPYQLCDNARGTLRSWADGMLRSTRKTRKVWRIKGSTRKTLPRLLV